MHNITSYTGNIRRSFIGLRSIAPAPPCIIKNAAGKIIDIIEHPKSYEELLESGQIKKRKAAY